MNLPIFVILLQFFTDVYTASLRVNFSKCGVSGFTCITNSETNKAEVTYQCPIGVNDATIYINQFNSPSNIDIFKILNCQSLTVFTKCTGERKQIRLLQIANIKHLSIQRLSPYDPMLPPKVIFENIAYISEIPAKSFGQIDKVTYSSGCYVQPMDFQNILFKNVGIGTIKSEAIVAHDNFQNFTFSNVTVDKIETFGINIKHSLNGSFEIRDSSIKEVEHLGIQTHSQKVVYATNDLKEVASSGINATTEHFYFTGNLVGNLQPQALSVLGTKIYILRNQFKSLKSGTFEKVGPGLLKDSGRNFGKLSFVYDFSENTVQHLEVGSLHPDYISYENVRTEIKFDQNKITCTCDNLAWLVLPAVLESTPNMPFYEMVIDKSYGYNMCDKSDCELHISVVNQLVECGKCLTNITLNDLCEEPSTVGQSSTNLAIPSSYSISSSIKTFVQPLLLLLVLIL